ncbi:Eukaryotic translation initiation factor 3 subunit A, partial [Orchesella cincta]
MNWDTERDYMDEYEDSFKSYLKNSIIMALYYQRPGNALKKASEFIEVGKPTRALDTLYDVIKGEKYLSFSEKVIEPIMLKYLELCVELKKAHTAKEGLYQYRLMCQSVSIDVNVNISAMEFHVIKDNAKTEFYSCVNVGLLEKVIRSYIRMAEDKTETAKALIEKKTAAEASAESISIVEVDDLDNLSMADMTLLNVVTEEQAQERSGRTALIPWVKFLWESYTQCLDLLRNNPRLENLYHDIAQMAFKFCLAYSRKTEFRSSVNVWEKHFDDIINRQGSQMNSIDFSSPETQQLNMETRLSQLDSAITLELWQDAYKAIEDIHLLMNQSKKSQTRMMAYYYQKLSLVFWKAGNLLFHAATLMKILLVVQRHEKECCWLLWAIPFPVLHPEFERFVETDKGMLEKSQKLATLLFLPQPPTRASIIRDISRHGILTNAIQPLQDLYEVLENQFNPLSLCADVEGLLKIAAAAGEHPTDYMEQYIDPLREVTLVRLIKQISQVYQTIDYDHLMNMTVFSNQIQLEQILVDAVRYTDMQITVDHRSNCIKPHLQIMPSETVRLQLVNIMDCLQDTVEMISSVQVSREDDIIRDRILAQLRQTEAQYHRSLIARHKIIAERREELERSAVDKRSMPEQMIKQQMMMEAKRLETERDEREKKKVKSEKLGKVEWEAHDAQRIAHLIEERKIAVRMREDKDKFLKNLLDARRDLFMEKLNEFEKSFRAEKTRRMAERKDQRKQERRRKHDEDKAAAEQARQKAARECSYVPPSRRGNQVLGASFVPPTMRGSSWHIYNSTKKHREAFADSKTSDEDKPESTIDYFRGKRKCKKEKPNKAGSLSTSQITKVPGKGMNSFGFFNYSHNGDLLTPIIPAHKEFMRDTGILALDCEMVGVGPKRKDALGRISIVNEFGYCLYDKFVKPSAVVTEYRTPYSGIRKKDLKNATPYSVVKNEVLDIIDGRIIFWSVTAWNMILGYFGKVLNCGRWTPSLKSLTWKILGVEIQEGEHSSITDAQAAMALYRVRQNDWEKSVRRKHKGEDILKQTLARFEDLNVTS